MTPIAKTILDRWQVRKSAGQRRDFRYWLRPILEYQGWQVREEKGAFGARNIVIGDVDKARVIYTAHYDTCVRLPVPNFITPKAPVIYILYQLLLSVVIIGFMFAGSFALGIVGGLISEELILPLCYLGCYAVLTRFYLGPANRHNANDNTSGVTAVIDLALALPVDQRDKVAFVLFDLEEAGLFGSKSFAKKHKDIRNNTLLVNMDCVSDGETMLFCFRKGSRNEVDRFRAAFPADERITPDFVEKGYVNPSDHMMFKHGVGIAAMKKTKGGLLYMNRIHTKKDTIYRSENIAWLVEGCIRLTERL